MLVALLVVFDALQLLRRQAVESILNLRSAQAVISGERRPLVALRLFLLSGCREIRRSFADLLLDRLEPQHLVWKVSLRRVVLVAVHNLTVQRMSHRSALAKRRGDGVTPDYR